MCKDVPNTTIKSEFTDSGVMHSHGLDYISIGSTSWIVTIIIYHLGLRCRKECSDHVATLSNVVGCQVITFFASSLLC